MLFDLDCNNNRVQEQENARLRREAYLEQWRIATRDGDHIRRQQILDEMLSDAYNEVKGKFVQQHTQITDSLLGCRWIECECCGEIKTTSDFADYGGINRVNLGTCLVCSRNKGNNS